MRKPRLLTKCVANAYASDGERIAEFSNGQGVGGLFRLYNNTARDAPPGQLIAEIYRCDPLVRVICDPDRIGLGSSDADGLLRAAERAIHPQRELASYTAERPALGCGRWLFPELCATHELSDVRCDWPDLSPGSVQ